MSKSDPVLRQQSDKLETKNKLHQMAGLREKIHKQQQAAPLYSKQNIEDDE